MMINQIDINPKKLTSTAFLYLLLQTIEGNGNLIFLGMVSINIMSCLKKERKKS